MSEHPPGTFVPKQVLQQMFLDAINTYEGVFAMEVNPRDFKEIGKLVITISGVPKES